MKNQQKEHLIWKHWDEFCGFFSDDFHRIHSEN